MTTIKIQLFLLVLVFSFQSMAQGNFFNFKTSALFGRLELSKGFEDISKEIEVSVIPTVNVQNLNFCMNCEGFLGEIPVFELEWTGETDQLRIHFEPKIYGTDACLAVYTPLKQWLYVDNMDMGQKGPFLYLHGHDSGLYKIFVGGRTEKDTISGKLIITESYIPDESIRESDVGLNVGFVPTPRSKVDSMLNLVQLQPGDYLIDLGCGDGRIVIEAAKRGALAHGVDLDPLRIEDSWKNAKNADVLEKVSFEEANIFDVDLSQATVISTYLLDKINEALIPKFLDELKPGTRIVSYSFRMGDWEPDIILGEDCQKIYLWTVPANVNGNWSLTANEKSYKMQINQKYQEIEVFISENEIPLSVSNVVLSGARISFTLSNPKDGIKYSFIGSVTNDVISGNVRSQSDNISSSSKWSAFKQN